MFLLLRHLLQTLQLLGALVGKVVLELMLVLMQPQNLQMARKGE